MSISPSQENKILELYAAHYGKAAIARAVGCSRVTIYKVLQQVEKKDTVAVSTEPSASIKESSESNIKAVSIAADAPAPPKPLAEPINPDSTIKTSAQPVTPAIPTMADAFSSEQKEKTAPLNPEPIQTAVNNLATKGYISKFSTVFADQMVQRSKEQLEFSMQIEELRNRYGYVAQEYGLTFFEFLEVSLSTTTDLLQPEPKARKDLDLNVLMKLANAYKLVELIGE